jgi:hypothetical protein
MSLKSALRLSAAMLSALVVAVGIAHPAAAEHHESALVKESLSAAPPEVAAAATVVDWEGKVLKQGDNGWTCMPTPPHLQGTAPMCFDAAWMEWGDAYMNKAPYAGGKFGISYMLAGDNGSSNIDPYAEGPTEDNQWVVEGPHIMILVPDPAMLAGISTNPENGGPYVMWAGTPYVHIMVPVNRE